MPKPVKAPTMPARDKVLVSIGEAAALCSVSRATFYNWVMPAVRTGIIRSMRVGHNLRIFTASLLAWLDQQADAQQ